MSDTTLSLLPGSSTADETDEETGAPARAKVLVVGVALAVALAAAGWTLLGSDGGQDDLALAAPPPAALAAPQDSASASPTPSPSPTSSVPAAVARDPFAPQVAPAAPAARVDPPADAAPGTGSESGSDEVLPPPPTGGGGDGGGEDAPAALPTAPPAGPPAAPPAGTVVTGLRLALVGVAGAADVRTAVLSLDGVRQTVAVSQSFGPASSLLLLSIQQGPGDGQWTAVVQRGQGEPFDVVTGAPVTVP